MSDLERYTMGFLGVVFVPLIYAMMVVGTVALIVLRLGPLVTSAGHVLFAVLVAVLYGVVFWVSGLFLVWPLVRDSWAMLTRQGPWK